MSRMPDYIGRWLLDEDRNHYDAIFKDSDYDSNKLLFDGGFFRLFITGRKKISNLEEGIYGIILDSIGLASFSGKVERGEEKDRIAFIKRYEKEAVDAGLSIGEIPYVGEGKLNICFSGHYIMKEENREWKAGFRMIKYEGIGSEMNLRGFDTN